MFSMLKVPLRLAAILCVCSIAGCGGGGGGGGPAQVPRPSTPVGDTTAPETSVVETHQSGTHTTSALTFTPASNENGVTFEGSVDGGAFAAVSVPWQLSELAEGDHTVSIRARDAAGNVDSTPYTFSWRIDSTAPVATIVFPPPVSYSHASTITVRGTGSDISAISSINVNGVAATTTDNYRTWSAEVPIPTVGGAAIVVSTADEVGHTNALADIAEIRTGPPPLTSIGGMDYDPKADQIVISDTESNAIYGFHALSGTVKMISGNGSMGAITVSGTPGPLVVDAAQNRALIADRRQTALIAVNLVSGGRSMISGPDGNAAHDLVGPVDIALDAAGNRAFVISRNNASIVQVDLEGGARTVVASSIVGGGAALRSASALVYDNVTTPGTPRLLVSEDHSVSNPQLIQIDLDTLERTALQPITPSSISLGGITEMALDAAERQLLVMDFSNQRFVAIDLDTYDRTLLGGPGAGSGDAIAGLVGMAFRSTSRTLFTGQSYREVLATNLNTGVRSTFAHSRLGTGERMSGVLGVAIEQPNGVPQSLLVTELWGRLTRIDLSSGNRTTVSDLMTGGGTSSLTSPVDVVLDTRPSAQGSAALVLQGSGDKGVVSVDLRTGSRTKLANLSNLERPWNFGLDAPGNRVLVTDQDVIPGAPDALYSVDLSTGATTELSGPNKGAGPNLVSAWDVILEPALNPTRAIVSDPAQRALMAVDLASGNREHFLSTANSDFYPGALFLDSANSWVIGFDEMARGSLFAVSMPSGTKFTLSGIDGGAAPIGTGPNLGFAQGLDVDVVNRVAYTTQTGSEAVLAVDLVTGERVLVSH